MKKREIIMGIREQSNERMVRENLWYFNEDSANNFSSVLEEGDSRKLDSEKKIIKERYDQPIPKSIGRNRPKRECSFVVDWQLSDSL